MSNRFSASISKDFMHPQLVAATCTGKDGLTWAQAKGILDRRSAKERGFVAYHCPICRAWHVGSPPRKQRRWK